MKLEFEDDVGRFDTKFDIETKNIDIGMDNVYSSGTSHHNRLLNRDLPDQHPIESITGLKEALNNMIRADDTTIIFDGNG